MQKFSQGFLELIKVSLNLGVVSWTYATRDIPEDRHHHAHTLYGEDGVEDAALPLVRHA